MDRLTAFVVIAHAKLRLQYLPRHPELLDEVTMTPKLQGLTAAMSKLKHSLEVDADNLMARMQDAGAASSRAFAKAH